MAVSHWPLRTTRNCQRRAVSGVEGGIPTAGSTGSAAALSAAAAGCSSAPSALPRRLRCRREVFACANANGLLAMGGPSVAAVDGRPPTFFIRNRETIVCQKKLLLTKIKTLLERFGKPQTGRFDRSADLLQFMKNYTLANGEAFLFHLHSTLSKFEPFPTVENGGAPWWLPFP